MRDIEPLNFDMMRWWWRRVNTRKFSPPSAGTQQQQPQQTCNILNQPAALQGTCYSCCRVKGVARCVGGELSKSQGAHKEYPNQGSSHAGFRGIYSPLYTHPYHLITLFSTILHTCYTMDTALTASVKFMSEWEDGGGDPFVDTVSHRTSCPEEARTNWRIWINYTTLCHSDSGSPLVTGISREGCCVEVSVCFVGG